MIWGHLIHSPLRTTVLVNLWHRELHSAKTISDGWEGPLTVVCTKCIDSMWHLASALLANKDYKNQVVGGGEDHDL